MIIWSDTTQPVVTLDNFESNTEYQIFVKAVDKDGVLSDEVKAVIKTASLLNCIPGLIFILYFVGIGISLGTFKR